MANQQYPPNVSQQKTSGTNGIHLTSALLFLIFGIVLILKLLKFNYLFLQYVPDEILYWIVAIGCTFGGLYMIYKGYIYRHKMIFR